MPGPSFTERYVIARDSNVLRVDFARRPDPPAPRFPGAGALRPATSRVAPMDQGEPQARSASSRLVGEGGLGVAGARCVASPLPVRSPQMGKGVAPDLVLVPSVVGLAKFGSRVGDRDDSEAVGQQDGGFGGSCASACREHRTPSALFVAGGDRR
jgi:hypothetical protein